MPLKASAEPKDARKLGIIAGMGSLPVAVAQEAKKAGYEVIAFALKPPADDSLKPVADEFHAISIGKFGRLLSLLKKLSVKEAVMAGKVSKRLLYADKKKIIPDLQTVKLFFSLKNRSDDTILLAVVKELEKHGIRIHETTTFTRDLLAPEGVLTRKKPSPDELDDVRFGWRIAKEIGQLDIGQTVVVKNMAVMAIEAIEGTDEAVRRGGNLAVSGAVVVKVSKPRQDMRFDVPAVGPDTLRAMHESSSKVLALEAGKCIILEKNHFLQEADRRGMVVLGMKHD